MAPKAKRAGRLCAGVVFGSEIMKKAKRMRLPEASWWRRTSRLWPSQRTRAARKAKKEPRNARLTSLRKARCATMQPRANIQRRRRPPSPHCAGEHQAWGVASMAAVMPRFAGLRKWRPRMRVRDLGGVAGEGGGG